MRKKYNPDAFTYESLQKEREYGFFWYSGLWKVLRPVLIGLCSLLVTAGIVIGVCSWVYNGYFSPVGGADAQAVEFTVASGSSLTRVANQLETAGLIRNRTVFKYYADFLGYGQKIQAGKYSVSPAMKMTDILELLTTGDGNPITRNITVIPGWGVEEIASYLLAEGVIASPDRFLSLCRSGDGFEVYYYIADVKATGNAGSRRYVLEGYLAPDTYEIYTSATEEDILKKLLSQTEAVFRDSYHERAEEIGMTMDEVLTLASIIEKEAKTADFAKVSAVFHNRLSRNMPLGSDVTVKYASGVRRMSLTGSDLQFSSPYNTYLIRGLPVGPVCSPSAAAIYAALYPDTDYLRGGYLYFCSKNPDTGELYFSRTLEEHEQAVSIYSPLWQAYDREKGYDR